MGEHGRCGLRELRGAVICMRATALSAFGIVHALLVVAPRVAPRGRRLMPASTRSKCLHAVIGASLREDVLTPPLAVALPCPVMRPLELTYPDSHSVALALALRLSVAVALLPSHRVAGWFSPRSAYNAGQALPAASVRRNARWQETIV